MFSGAGFVKKASFFQILQNVLIGFFDEFSAAGKSLFHKTPFVNGYRNIVRFRRFFGKENVFYQIKIIFSESGRDVHHPRPLRRFHEIGRQRLPEFFFSFTFGAVKRFVLPADEFPAGNFFNHFGRPASGFGRRIMRPEKFSVDAVFSVSNRRIDGHGDVGGKRPRRCRPNQKIFAAARFFSAAGRPELELYEDGRVFGFSIDARLAEFVGGKRCLAARAIRRNPV